MPPKFFRTRFAFRTWLRRHHALAHELLVGFHRHASGKPSVSWPEAVDEALCYGWIDGVRRRVDEASYCIRFTPRRPGSIWSAVNIRRVQALIAARRMRSPGLQAFARRRANRSGRYSYEQRPHQLPAQYARLLARNAAAHKFFHAQTASYRRAAIWWVLSARRDATRLQRARRLLSVSQAGRLIAQFVRRRT
jgi:uncharacterized protein YdeI (YjbR/CyaY-like superfamily)